jgi:hypothetical protein
MDFVSQPAGLSMQRHHAFFGGFQKYGLEVQICSRFIVATGESNTYLQPRRHSMGCDINPKSTDSRRINMDVRAFIQTAVSVNATDNASLRLQPSGDQEQLPVAPSTFIGKVAAVLRSIFNITSDSERQAMQIFISAIRQDYGSSGLEALKQLDVHEDKPLQLNQVRQLSQRLQSNHA